MGTFDTFGKCAFTSYNIGDSIDIADGIYVGYEGVVVIHNNSVVATFPNGCIYDKWGKVIDIDIDSRNPINSVIEAIEDHFKRGFSL